MKLIKIFVSYILIFCVLVGSSGITILSHLCKQENEVYVSFLSFPNCNEECRTYIDENFLPPSEKDNSCCENHDDFSSSFLSSIVLKEYSNCCENSKFSPKLNIYAIDKTFQRIVEILKFQIKVEFLKFRFTDNLKKVDTYFSNFIVLPIRKLIVFLHHFGLFNENSNLEDFSF
ncbi:MAG: hypothetical protein N2517_03660 [Ignavibacteria bacterium]|nr:hypothetical protein [Ignavibacteria bacterium]